MKNADLIAKLSGLPASADVELHLGEEYHDFSVEHSTSGAPSDGPHLIALEPEPLPPGVAQIVAKQEQTTLASFRDLVEAAEAAGWDTTENKEILQRGRDAYAALAEDLGAADLEPDGTK